MAAKGGAPVLPGLENVTPDSKEAREAAKTLGLPLLVKAAAGGGGKGMRVVREASELAAAERRQAEAVALLSLAPHQSKRIWGKPQPFLRAEVFQSG